MSEKMTYKVFDSWSDAPAFPNIRYEVTNEISRQMVNSEDIYIVVADMALMYRGTDLSFPEERLIDVGIAEQNMVGIAAGLAYEGKICFTSTVASIAVCRPYEQIRDDVCYPNLPVNFIGQTRGLTYGPFGCTHTAPDDIAALRAIPNIRIVIPCDLSESIAAVRACIDDPGPTYIGLGNHLRNIYTDDIEFKIGKANKVREGSDVTIIACGDMVGLSLDAAEKLAAEGIQARVLSMHTIKPLDVEAVKAAAEETGAIVTVEDAYLTGGLGEAVSSALIEDNPCPIKRLAEPDEFHKIARFEELLNDYGLTEEGIISAAKQVIAKKAK